MSLEFRRVSSASRSLMLYAWLCDFSSFSLSSADSSCLFTFLHDSLESINFSLSRSYFAWMSEYSLSLVYTNWFKSHDLQHYNTSTTALKCFSLVWYSSKRPLNLFLRLLEINEWLFLRKLFTYSFLLFPCLWPEILFPCWPLMIAHIFGNALLLL